MTTRTAHNIIPTLREADKIAKKLGLTRGEGTYNNCVYWRNDCGHIVTPRRLEELAGLTSSIEDREKWAELGYNSIELSKV